MIRAKQYAITFEAVDSVLFPALKTGLAFASGDAKISKDGGSFVNTTNAPAEIGTTGVYALTLTAAEMDAAWIHVLVQKTGMQPSNTRGATTGNPSGSVVANGSNTGLTFCTDLAATATDHYKDAFLMFTSGALAGQVHKVTAYNGSTKFVTFTTAFSAAPSAADRFIIINGS
jgi:hypothetical protein